MNAIDQIVLFRGAERLIIILFCGLSLVLGWHLFKIGILSEQQSEIKVGKIWIKFQKVGPGVFFALFGVAVFVYSLSSPFNFEIFNTDHTDEKESAKPTPFVAKGSYLTQDQKKYLELSKSINTIRDIYLTSSTTNISYTDKQLLIKSMENLEKERDVWVGTLFGLKSLSLWYAKGNRYLISPESVDMESRKQLEVITPWMSDILK